MLPTDTELGIGRMGPAMTKLDPQQRRFVYAVMELGSNSFADAALAAGYKGDLRMKGYHLSHNELIQRAFGEETRKRLTAHLPMAASVLVGIISKGDVEPKDKMKAIEMLFNRTGMHEVREERHMVEVHTVDDNELIRQARAFVKEMKLPIEEARKLLGNHADEILEGVYTEVLPAPVPEELAEEEALDLRSVKTIQALMDKAKDEAAAAELEEMLK